MGFFRVWSNQGQPFAYVLERENPLWKIIIIKQYLKERGFPGGTVVVKRHVFDPWVWQDPLEYELATHLNILAWKIPWREQPGRIQSMGSQRVGHGWVSTHTLLKILCMCAKSCPTLGNSMDCTPPGSSVHGILQARILEWVVMPSSRGSTDPGMKP